MLPDAYPEVELLLCCAGVRPDAARLRQLLARGLDWTGLLRIAEAHGLAPLVCWRLKEACAEAVPREVLDRLEDGFRRNTGRNLYLTGELFRILELLAAAGVAAIPFKGPVLAWWLYPHPGLREFSDLDLLVRARDVARAREVLRSQGYRPQIALEGALEDTFLRWNRQMALAREDGRATVDLHWGLTARCYAFPLELEGLWSRAAPVSVGGRQVLTFCPEDQLQILALHGVKHCWTWLGPLCDIAALIEACPMDWARVMAQAEAMRRTRTLFLALRLSADLLGTVLPGEVWKQVQADARTAALAEEVRRRLLTGPPGGDDTLLQLRLMERLRDKARFCLGMVFEPTQADWESLRIPPTLFPAYYLLRPVRLVVKHALRQARRFLGGMLEKWV